MGDDPDEAFGLPAWPHLWRNYGICVRSDGELAEWEERMASARDLASGFLYALLYLVTAGTLS